MNANTNVAPSIVPQPELNEAAFLYDDGKIVINGSGITLKSYYFPTFQEKYIPFKSIKSYEVSLHRSIFQMKGWGMGADFMVWWHLDFGRSLRDRNSIIIDIGSYPQIGMTPGGGDIKNVQQVAAILEKYVSS